MPEQKIIAFSIARLSVLDEEGNADEDVMPDLADSDLVRLYELLLLTRAFDDRALNLQREGRIGTYPSTLGQEAAQVGSAFALEKSDWVFPSFRELGVFITLGYPLDEIYQYWTGDERGLICPEGLQIFPVCIAVGTHIPHAVGAAMAAKYRKDKTVVACYFGDGATSKGDFHEGLNMAGVFQAPVVFICQNNQWAISVPLKHQTASETLAQKALAYGISGIQVDGNDILAVFRATREALQKVRAGGGPTLIECKTYRLADHTTADDASRYRNQAEVESWRKKDPLLRYQRFLEKRGLWTSEHGQAVADRIKQGLDAAVAIEEAATPADPGEMFDYTYARMSPRQVKQRKDCTDG